MRLWTLHPRYLDAAGLVALWREGLLARAVLRGRTRGYRHHPQLERFRSHPAPCTAINRYLSAVLAEAAVRGYAFNGRSIGAARGRIIITVSKGQLTHEWQHLLRKLRHRSPALYRRWREERSPKPHPLFRIVGGGVASWERSKPAAQLKVAAALQRRRRSVRPRDVAGALKPPRPGGRQRA